MTLPQLPTDNLYKFMFLAGLTILGVSVFVYIQKFGEIKNSLNNIETDALNAKLAFYKDTANMNYALAEIDRLQEKDSIQLSKIQSKVSSKILITPLDTQNLMENLKNSTTKINIASRNLLDSKISSHNENEKLMYKLDKLAENNRLLIWLGVVCGITSLIGGIIARNGYVLWKTKVQKLTDEKLELELKSLRDKPGSSSQ